MKIKGVSGHVINDSRGDKTILVKIKTTIGDFESSAPNGKSKGKHEAKSYKKNIEGDCIALGKLSEYFSEEFIEKFEDLRRIEDVVSGHIGGNTLFAFESAVLKAVAKEQKKEVWQVINPRARKVPRLVGNCIGGGLHSELIDEKRPDFQEFLLIPKPNSMIEGFQKNNDAKKMTKMLLKKEDPKFRGTKNDENAWMTSLNEKEVLEVLSKVEIPMGLDIAASGFYKRKKYNYQNPPLKRTADEQIIYIANLAKKFGLIYTEDPFDEEDFLSHAKLMKLIGNRCMVVGDDLTVTNYNRLEKAIKMKAINALIMKPNQNGSLLDVARVAKLAKKHNVKMIFSHRSGETMEYILADLAFGFGADFIKCGITGDVRQAKIKRMIEIEKSLK